MRTIFRLTSLVACLLRPSTTSVPSDFLIPSPIFNPARPLNQNPEALIHVVHDTFPQTREHVSLPFYSTLGPDDNKNGTTIALNELLRYEHIHNTRGLTICLKTTGWCASENDKGKSCTEQYFEASPTCICTSIPFHDDVRDGFTISIKGTIFTQFVLKDHVGTILGATKNHAFNLY